MKINKKDVKNFVYKAFFQTHRFWQMSILPPIYWLLLLIPIKLFWEPFSLKRSHWFTWLKRKERHGIRYKDINNNLLITVSNDPSLSISRFPIENFIGLNWTWRMTTILRPVSHKEKYQIGFIRQDGIIVFCSVVIPNGPIAVIQSPVVNKFFAFSCEKSGQRKQIELEIIKKNIDKWQLNEVALL